MITEHTVQPRPRLTARFRSFTLAPEWVFAWLSLVVGLLVLVITPPFQVADEPQHYFRSYQLATGTILPVKNDEHTGGYVAVSVHDVVAALLGDIPFNPDNKISVATIRAAFGIPLDRSNEGFVDFRTAALYHPVTYLPQTIGMALGRLLDLPALALLYLGRLCALLTATSLITWAIRLTPIAKWTLVVIALLPMSMFLRASLSADVLVISLGLVWLALCLRFALTDAPLRKRDYALLFGIGVLLMLAKQSYFVLPLALVIVPLRRWGSWLRFGGFMVALLGTGLVLILIWTLALRSSFTPSGVSMIEPGAVPQASIEPTSQARSLLTNPMRLFGAIPGDVQNKKHFYFSQFIGELGWLDTKLPMPLKIGYALLLVGVALLDGHPRLTLNGPQRGVLLMVALGNVLLLYTIAYVLWNSAGSSDIWGMQGRYFIPIAPLLLVLLHNRRSRIPPPGALAISAACLATSLVMLDVLLLRYFGV